MDFMKLKKQMDTHHRRFDKIMEVIQSILFILIITNCLLVYV